MKIVSKNMKITTQLLIGFIVIDIVMILSLYVGYTSASKMLTVADPEAYLSKYAYTTALFFILMIICTSGIAITLLGTIKKAFAEVNKASSALAAGKTDITLKKMGNNEFGKLINDIQTIVDNIDKQAKVVQEVADGDMTVVVEPKSEDDTLGNALKLLVERNRDAISNVKDAAHQVSVGAGQVSNASEALAEGSTEQASAIQQITASIVDVAEKTRKNAEQANMAASLVGKTIETVKEGNKEMKEMVVAMDDINNSSERISKIIKVIDDIAFQTNILALNAAVEAARAGEAGKGFAVVADEVRNLAAKSAAAALETEEMIEDSIRKVVAGGIIAGETAKSLEEITKAVEDSEKLIVEIADASNYQASAITQIDQAVEQVSQVVQTNSATSEECAAASVELTNQAARVSDLISMFKIEKEEAV